MINPAGISEGRMDYTNQPPFLLQEVFEWHSVTSFTESHECSDSQVSLRSDERRRVD